LKRPGRKICQALKEQLNTDVYARWIAVINPRKLEADKLVLSVSNDFTSPGWKKITCR